MTRWEGTDGVEESTSAKHLGNNKRDPFIETVWKFGKRTIDGTIGIRQEFDYRKSEKKYFSYHGQVRARTKVICYHY